MSNAHLYAARHEHQPCSAHRPCSHHHAACSAQDCAQRGCWCKPCSRSAGRVCPLPVKGATFCASAALPWRAPDLLIALPCFGASPCACQCCPDDRASGSPVRGSLPQGDAYERSVNHLEALLRAVDAARLDPRRIARCSNQEHHLGTPQRRAVLLDDPAHVAPAARRQPIRPTVQAGGTPASVL